MRAIEDFLVLVLIQPLWEASLITNSQKMPKKHKLAYKIDKIINYARCW